MRDKQFKILVGTLATILVVGAATLAYKVKGANPQQARASNSLAEYTKSLGLTSLKAVCNKDSDGDGYASCSYSNGKLIVNVECDSALVWSTDACKSPKNMFNN